MSREYELAFRMNAELDARFTRTFNNASDRIGELERRLRNMQNMGRSGGGFGKGIIHGLTSIGKAAGLAAGGALAGGILASGFVVKNSLEKAMNFEAQMSSIQALTGASNAELTKMQTLALKMGASTKYSAMEAAQGIEELLKAGLRPATVQAGGLEAALNLATAGGLELAEAAATMATSMNAFKKDAMTAATVSNILAGTANAAATDVHELSYAIASGGGVADMAGLSFRDFNTAIGLMSNDGLKSGSDAGTSFKSMLMYLQPQTDKAAKLFNKLGIGVGKVNKFFEKGKIKNIEGLADVLQKAFKGMSEQERTDKMLEMFGTDAIKAVSSLFKAGSEGVKKFQKDMANVTALDVAKKKMDNASGAVEQFKGALETLQISALLPTMPMIKDLALEAADFVEKYTPQITAGIQRMVDNSKKYLNDHFFNNPEFQKLQTFESKVDFIFTDVLKSFNSWWSSSGNAAFKTVTEELTDTLLGTLEASVPELTEIGLKLGSSLVSGMWEGMRNSKAIGWLIKIGDGTYMENMFRSAGADVDWYKPKPQYNLPASSQYTGEVGIKPPTSSSPNTNGFQDALAKVRGYATGGYITRPELAWIGEGGSSEWVIPENNSKRSRNLWEAAGNSMGYSSGGGGDFSYSPTYVFQGDADKQAIDAMEQRSRADFESQFNAYKEQQRRVSFQ